MRAKPITLRRVAALRELASLGCWQSKAAALLGMDDVRVCQIAGQFGVSFPKRPNLDSPLCRAIRAGYAEGLSPEQVAIRTGSTVGSVRARASQMGITRASSRDPGKHIRGYEIPDHQRAEYRALRLLGLSFKECGYELGILVRPSTLHLTAMPNVNTAHKFSEA